MAGYKLNMWLKYFLDDSCKTTFLNRKESAIKAGYKAKHSHTYAVIGSQNFKRFKEEIEKWLDENGYSANSLKIKLLSLMDARESKFIKVKGAISSKDLPPGVLKIATTGTIEYTEDGKEFSNGETVLAIDVEAIETQRRSLDMALKVKGLNAPEKHEHTGLDGKEIIPIINVTTTGNRR